MTDLSREELAARLEAIEARTDTKFEKLLGEIKDARSTSVKEIAVLTSDIRGDLNTFKAEMSGKLDSTAARAAGKWTVWGAAGTVIVALIATLLVFGQIAQTAYDTGINAEQRASEAAVAAVAAQTAQRKLGQEK